MRRTVRKAGGLVKHESPPDWPVDGNWVNSRAACMLTETTATSGQDTGRLHAEWLLTNGLGGYALGHGHLVNLRKYHGLLVAAGPQGSRHHLVSCVEERFQTAAG